MNSYARSLESLEPMVSQENKTFDLKGKIQNILNITVLYTGRYPCLWCTILSQELHLPANQRKHHIQLRTLENLQQTLQEFMDKANGNLKRAKEFHNVIHKPILDIPIDQVTIYR